MPQTAVSTSVLRRMEQVFDRFEDDLLCRRPQPLSAYLAGLGEPERSAVFRELLALELQYRLLLGETPTVRDYVAQYPTKVDVIRDVWSEVAGHAATGPPAGAPQGLTGRLQGTMLGHYRLAGCLGAGGMGEVYQAEDARIAGRRVALKVLPPSQATPEAVRRFQREGAAALQLQHEHVVRCFELGEHNGLHFLVMELIDGSNLAEHIKRQGPLSVPDTARLGYAVALALDHAHRLGIVHRDIKPSNILLSSDGGIKLADLGLAKFFLSGPSEAPQGPATRTGTFMGTVDYIAPEQAEDPKHADIRSDLYSLGCTLYHCLVGRPPFSGGEIQKVLGHRERMPPAIVSQNPAVPPEFAALIEKRLLAKRPEDRFQTPGELTAAMKPWTQEGAAIQAAKPAPSPARFINRKRLLVAAGLAAALLILLFGATIIILETSKARVRIAIDDKLLQAGVTIRVDGDEIQIAGVGDTIRLRPGRHTLEIRRGDVLVQSREFQVLRDNNPLLEITLEGEAPRPPLAAGTPPPQTQRLAEPTWLDRLERARLPSYELKIASGGDPAKAPKELVGVIGDGRMRHWGEVQAVAYSPDGKHVASGGADKKVRVWDATTGDEVFTLLGHTSTVVTVAYSADGKYLASAGWDTTIRLWDAKAGKEIRTLTGHDGQVYKVAFSPDSDRLVSGAAPNVNQVQVWDVATGQKIRSLVGHQGMVYGVAYSPDGRRIATCSLDQTVRIWDAQTGQELRTLKEFARVDRQGNNWVLSVAFSPDSKHVAAGSRDGIVRIWDADSGQQLQSLNIPAQHNNSGRIWTVAYHPDGHHLACTSDSEQFGKHEVIILDTKTWRIVDTIQTGRGGRFAYSSDGKRWVLACLQNRIRICDAETGKEVLPLTEYSTIKAIAFSGDGYRLAVAGQFLDREVHHAVKVRDLRTNQEIMTLKTSEDPLSTVFSPGALRLASRLVNLGFWDVGSGRQLSTAKGLAVRMGQPMPLAFTPDGGRVAAGVSDGKVVIFEVAKGTLQREFQAHGAQVTAVLYSPDGQWLVTGGQDRLLKLWAAGSAQAKGDLFGHAGVIQTLAFSADGQFLASAGSAAVEDKEPWAEIILWRFPEQKEQLKFRTDSQRVFSLSFSSDGALLASAGDDGRVSLWQTSSGKRRQTWQFPGHVQQVLFAPDGRHLLTLNANGTVYILRLPDPAVLPK